MASAIAFDFPGMRQAVNAKECRAATGRGDKAAPSSSNLVIYRTATPWPLLYCQNWIPLALQTTDDPTGRVPKQSERVLRRPIDKGICNGDHLPANQSLPETALHPMEPAASQETWISGMGAQRGDNRNLYLLHDWKNSSHHDKSKWNPLLNLIGWSSLWKATSRLIVWRRKVRPEGTTLQACWRLPIKESSSFRVQWRFCDQETRSVDTIKFFFENRVLCLKQ